MTFEFGENSYRVHYFVVTTADPGRSGKAVASAG